MSARSVLLGALTGGTIALVVAVVCLAAGLSTFAAGVAGTLQGVAICGALGAVASLVGRRLPPPSSVSPVRLAAVGALLATLQFVLLHGHPLGFIGLNEVGGGAGPLGELVLATLPLLGAYAGAGARLFGADRGTSPPQK
jgi:hypothetical protein